MHFSAMAESQDEEPDSERRRKGNLATVFHRHDITVTASQSSIIVVNCGITR